MDWSMHKGFANSSTFPQSFLYNFLPNCIHTADCPVDYIACSRGGFKIRILKDNVLNRNWRSVPVAWSIGDLREMYIPVYPGWHTHVGRPAKFTTHTPFTHGRRSQEFPLAPPALPPPDVSMQPAGPTPDPTYPLGQMHSTYDWLIPVN
jgi:hypothetical protein